MKGPADSPVIYAISEGSAVGTNFLQQKGNIVSKIRRAAACGITHFQIREKELPATLLFELVRASVHASPGTGLKIMVNGRFDIAIAARADGVHLPSDGLPVDSVRPHVPKGFLIGVSAHTGEEVIAAKRAGADMILFGPVYQSPGKKAGVGIEKLREICEAALPVPVLALGGIDGTNFREVLEAGASGVAAIRFLNRLIERGEKINL